MCVFTECIVIMTLPLKGVFAKNERLSAIKTFDRY